ncbi:glucosidase 2 subunit beta-like isoform X2 [Mercurialis annua]|uniref:glucosidase 2 subunit beta-like isoform X2 n=1 Tax=Mercurialis annua TaxID=3986 RepID=UPI00215F2E3E|nr:glucosidase 2 subunit beta-like isoform X2 [Mercurialis annua]
MKMYKLWFFFSIGIIISLIKSSSSSSVSLLGIPPQDEDYFKKETINCENGSKKFTIAQLNDDFCDCPDGTDEPGTSACPQGKFFCRNVGHVPISLPSSRVNDDICDCCDGSDEYDGKTKCLNTCWEVGKAAREKLQKKIDMYKEGVPLRKMEIGQAKHEIASDKEELSILKNEEKTLKRVVKQLQVYKEQIEKAEEKERVEKEKEEQNKAEVKERLEEENKELSKTLVEDEAGDSSDDEQKKTSSSADDQIGTVDELPLDKHEKEEYGNMAKISDDESKSTEGLSGEELGRVVASRWMGGNTGNQEDEHDSENNHGSSKETSESTNDEVYDNSNDKEFSTGNDPESSNSIYKSLLEEEKGISSLSIPSLFKRIKNTARNIFQLIKVSPSPVDKLEADRIRKEFDDSTTRLSDIEARISSLTEKLKHDFGKENEFYTMYDKCFETKEDNFASLFFISGMCIKFAHLKKHPRRRATIKPN